MKIRTTSAARRLAHAMQWGAAALLLAAGGASAQQFPDPETGLMVIERPAGKKVEFDRAQSECVQTEQIRFGKGQPWEDCRVTHTRFVSTIGLLDFYHAQYCLSSEGRSCAKRALVIFANRAYFKDATVVLARLDPAGTRYDDPMVTGQDMDNLLVIAARSPKASAPAYDYRYWSNAAWKPLPADAWKKAVAQRAGHGVKVQGGVQPDAESLSARVGMAGPDGRVRMARVTFGFRKGAPTVEGIEYPGHEHAPMHVAGTQQAGHAH